MVFALVLAMCLSAKAQDYGVETAQPIGGFVDGVFPAATPGPSGAWELVDAFPNISFIDPVRVVVAPNDTDNIYVVCRNGEIWKMPDDATTTPSQRIRFLDRRSTTWGYADSGMLSFCFHPEFGTPGSPNRGYCYVFYQYSPSPDNSSEDNPSYMRVSRFTVPDGADQVDSNSELVLIQQFDRNNFHASGQLAFGPDGFLYIAFGDEGNASDSFEVTQMIDDRLFSGVLRIDVDQDPARSHPIRRQPQPLDSRPAGWPASFTQGYFIPDDNPWQDPSGGTLEEFWSIGLRSPFAMHVDHGTGNIWIADVGQGAREEINILQKGSNFQWPYKEGLVNGPKPIPSPLIGIENVPIYDYPRGDGGCVIGGFVYRGTELAGQLSGKYLFGDHTSRNLWAMTYVPGQAPQVEYLTSVFRSGGDKRGLGGICPNTAGEPYICELGDNGTNTGTIFRLTVAGTPIPDPPTLLSQTGVFSNLATLEPRSGLLPYDVNSPLWSDNAAKRRWIAIPNDGSHNSAAEQIQFSRQGNWEFPIGTVIVKHFDMPIDENDPSALRPLETRFLVKGTDEDYYGLTYRWNAQGTDATLLTAGETEDLTITEIGGSTRQQQWNFPSRVDCRTCHTSNAGHVLGLRTHGLNREMYFPDTDRTDNLLRAWNHIGLFAPALTEADIPGLLKAASLQDASTSRTHRMRSWLDSNCSQCHQPGVVLANFDARFTTPFGEQGLINGFLNGSYPVTDPRVIAPGDLSRSILYQRDNSLGATAMPPLAKNVIHAEAMTIMADWINSIPPSNITQIAGVSVSQSSTDSGGVAARAIDGATDGDWDNGSVTLTANTANPWWEIDLGEILDIDHLVIWPRTDCCSERMDGYYVFVSDVPFTSTDPAATAGQAGVYSQFFTTRPSPTHQIFANRTGRFVRVQLAGTNPLSLAEVEIFGTPPFVPPTPPTITSFVATPPSVTEGSGTTLSWTVDNGNTTLTSLSIDSGVGTVLDLSNIDVTPVAQTTYTITATNSEGSATASVTVNVTPPTGGGDEFVPDGDTVALYHFNGNYDDSSPNDMHLVPAGGVTRSASNLGWMSNPSGQAARFNAAGDSLSVAIPDSLVLPGSGQPLTIDARIYPDAWLAYGVDSLPVIALHQEWNAHLVVEDPKWGTDPRGPEVAASGPILVTAQQWAAAVSLGQWHQVRIEYDGAQTVTCSIDGVVVSSGGLAPDVERNSDWTLTLGNFDGYLDEVFITRSVIVEGPDTIPPTVVLSTQSATVSGAFTVDASFSENVTGLTLGDISVTNGNASALVGSGNSYSFNITPAAVGDVTVQLPATAAGDAAGNPSTASNVLTVAFDDTPVDTTPPTVVLSTPSTTVSSDFTVTANFDENVTGLAVGDISVTNGSASAFSGSGSSYTFNVTPATVGNVTVQLPAAAANDAAGNPNNASNLLAVAFDDTPPGGGGDEYTPDGNTVALYHFNGNYDDSSANGNDLTATGGVARSSANLDWMIDPTGEAARFSAIGDSLTVSIPDSLVLPGAGQALTIDARIYANAWLAYSIENLYVIGFHQKWDSHLVIEDTKWGTNPRGPEVVASGTELVTAQQWAAAVTLGEWHQVRIEYDGLNSVKCSIDGVEIASGNLPPNTDREEDWVLTLGNFDGYLDEIYITRSIIAGGTDTTPPAVVINTPSTTVSSDFTVDVSFSENVTGLELSDFSVTNGNASALSGSGASYSVNVTPAAIGNVTVQLPAGAASDAAGNASTASNLLTVAFDDTPVDTTPPTVVISTPSTTVSGAFTVDASFSENVSGLALGDISVTNGSASALGGSGSSYSFDITPGAIGNVMVQINAGAATDPAGNPSGTSNLLIVDFDDTPPGGGDEHAVDANTVALYHFNTDYGDSSPNQFDLSVGGNVQLSSDNLGWMGTPSGQVARFGAIGDTLSVSIPDNLLLDAGDTRPLTIEARIYPRAWLGYGIENLPIIVLDQDWDTNLTFEDSKWGTNPQGPKILSAGVPITTAAQWAAAAPIGQWAELQISYDSTGTISAWINGQPAGSVTLTPNIDRDSDWTLTLGNFDGDIDEVYIHRSAPSATSQAAFAITAAQAVAAGAFADTGEVDSQLDADPDGDGRINLLEVAFGSDPMASDASPVYLGRTSEGETTLTFPVPIASQLTATGFESAAFSYVVQSSPDLQNWQACNVTGVAEEDAARDFKSVVIEINSDSESHRFFRLQVSTR